jgi:hypothetical protein
MPEWAAWIFAFALVICCAVLARMAFSIRRRARLTEELLAGDRRARRTISQLKDELAAARDGASQRLDEIRAERDAAVTAAAQAAAQLTQATAAFGEAEARCVRQFEAITQIEAQRDIANENYHRAVAGMSKAQAVMLREIGRLARLARTTPRKELAEMAAEYVEEHHPETGIGSPEQLQSRGAALAAERATFGLTEGEKAAQRPA